MRLLFVSHSLPPEDRPMDNIGGMQRVAADLHESLLSHGGGEVSTLVLRSPWSQRLWRTPVFMAGAIRRIRKMVAENEIDAVLFSSMVTASLVVPLRRHLSKHGVISAAIANGLDATTPTWPYPHFVRKVFESLDLVLPISNATAAACRERGLSQEKCSVVLLGIRLDRFSAPLARAEAKARMLAKFVSRRVEPRLVLCSVGRLVPRKGVAWFIEQVMPALPEDVCFLVAGEGPERGRITDAIRRHGLEHRVKLLGAISDSDVELLYQGSDLFVMPNVPVAGDMEGFGLVLVEAGLCGLPAVAAHLEGIVDVVTEGENGFLVESGNVAGFRNAVMTYYDSPDALSDASDRARRHTAATFGWDRVTQRYLTILETRARRG
ncbi:MAG: glycosyltransferase family 4 protein [Gemmatimonadaceae bacterium]